MGSLEQAREWHGRGNLSLAISCYQDALRSAPRDTTAWHDYAIALLQSRQAGEAVNALKRALEIEPCNPGVLLALSQACHACGRINDAMEYAKAATTSTPSNPMAWLLRGRLETISGSSSAESSLRRTLALMPDLDEAWHYLGEALQQRGRWDDAEHAYRQAMRSQPGEIMNVAICSEQAGRWEAARAAYRRMCELYPERRDCLARLAHIEAMLCDFEAAAETSKRLVTLMGKSGASPADDYVEPFVLSYLDIPDESRSSVLEKYAHRIQARASTPFPHRLAAPGKRLRIGYLSSDFGRHAVGTLVRGMFSAHDRNRYEVLGYSLKQYEDPVAEAIRSEFDIFHNLEGASSANIATIMDSDKLDVLIDLNGYTHGSRPEILAMRPARLQLGWLGFIQGHDAPWLDGLIMDEYVQPPGASWPFSDKVHYLPGLLLPCGPMPPGKSDRARFALPDNVPLLASFNNSYKLDMELVKAWIEILNQAKEAHLAIYLPNDARPHFVRTWEKCGGDLHRLHVLGHLPPAEQADRAASCDLFLDAFRYQAGATALASTAAGLPILSRSGKTPLSRLSSSLNHFLGLDELICHDTAEYIGKAVSLANDRSLTIDLRGRMLRSTIRTGLFDPRRASSGIEILVDRLLG